MTNLHEVILEAADALERATKYPHGIPAAAETRLTAGQACVRLCDGDQDKARTLWKLVTQELGYMPFAAAVALIRASKTENLLPDIEAPDMVDAPRSI